MKYFVANWKANKNLNEAHQWMEIFLSKLKTNKNLKDKLNINQLKIIICPSFPLIHPLKQKYGRIQTNLIFGAQDLSSFDEGSYTGEVTAKTLAGLVTYVILGHSERRRLINETNKMVKKKIIMAQKYQIEPIVCVRNTQDLPEVGVKFICYEPVHAIGSGQNETLEQILRIKKELNLSSNKSFFYGGSINETNIAACLKSNEIEGFIIGTASKDPIDFYKTVSFV